MGSTLTMSNFKILSMRYIKLAQKIREPKFQLSNSHRDWASVETNFCNGNGAWQTENFLSLKSCYLAMKSPKTWKSAIKKFHFSHHETNTSLIFHMWQVKIIVPIIILVSNFIYPSIFIECNKCKDITNFDF
jgi:hypothetical protein